MLSTDQWQLLIGLFVLCDVAWLLRKLFRQRDAGLWSAILPRLYLGGLYLYDGLVQRSRMEPINTMIFIGILLVFLSACINHFAEWRGGIKPQ